MSGFEMSAFGPVPIGTPYLDPKTDPSLVAHLIARPEFATAVNEPAPVVPAFAAPAPRLAPNPVPIVPAPVVKPLKRGSLLKSVRARIKEIKAELKHHAQLKAELAELERLLQAAKQKPIASVRPLRSVG